MRTSCTLQHAVKTAIRLFPRPGPNYGNGRSGCACMTISAAHYSSTGSKFSRHKARPLLREDPPGLFVRLFQAPARCQQAGP